MCAHSWRIWKEILYSTDVMYELIEKYIKIQIAICIWMMFECSNVNFAYNDHQLVNFCEIPNNAYDVYVLQKVIYGCNLIEEKLSV